MNGPIQNPDGSDDGRHRRWAPGDIITAADLLPDDLRAALNKITTPGHGAH